MNKKLLTAAVVLLAAGAVLLGIGTAIDRNRNDSILDLGAILQNDDQGENQAGDHQEPAFPGDNAVSDDGSASDDAAVSGENAAQLALDPFSNVALSVIAADVRFEEGEAYGLRYQLHPDELVLQAEVEGENLYFSTQAKEGASLSGDWEVVVTIPRDARLADVSVATVSGDITLSDRTMETLDLGTTSGAVEASAVTAGEIQVASTSGDIHIDDLSARSVNAASTSGAVSLTGTADSLNLGTTSGACAFSGDLTGAGNVGTVSGNIDVTVPDTAIEANSLGEITWNGRDQGPSFHRAGDGPALTLGSVSGDICITTK